MGTHHVKWSWMCLILATLYFNAQSGQSARILAFFPHPLMSHQQVYRPVIEALGRRGHYVTYVSGFQWKSEHPNVHHRMLDLSFIHELRNKIYDFSLEAIIERNSYSHIFSAPLNEAAMHISSKIVRDPVVQQLIKSDEHYDLVMTETFIGYEHFTAFAHKFNATCVTFLPRGDNSWANEMSGLPDNPAYMVDFKSPYSPIMSRAGRLHNAVILLMSLFHGYRYLIQSQAFIDKFFVYPGSENRPSINFLAADQALVLVNSHHSVGYSYPKAPHVKEVGGVSIQPPKLLPRKIREFVEGADHGVIYFSLGNYLDFSSPFAEETRNVLLEVFKSRKERVIWKWNGEGLTDRPSNIMFLQWVPQIDVLAHQKTKLFISHGGLLSMMEAVNFAVPVVGIIMGEDSLKNLRIAREAGFALDTDFGSLTVESLNDSIDEVINDPSYAKNAEVRSHLFKDRLLKPVDEAVYWIEYVLQHGKVLQPPSLSLKWYQVALWDLWWVVSLITFFTIFGLLILSACVIMILVRFLERRSGPVMKFVVDKDK